MKSLIKKLFFDADLVQRIQASNANAEKLYIELMNGKITLEEYLSATNRNN